VNHKFRNWECQNYYPWIHSPLFLRFPRNSFKKLQGFYLQIWKKISTPGSFFILQNKQQINPVEFFTPDLHVLQIILYIQLNGSTKRETILCQWFIAIHLLASLSFLSPENKGHNPLNRQNE
jgi:hypothetical protein